MTDVSIQGIKKSFEQDKNILDGLTFDVLHGERVGILGKNGAGKTTLFRIITGEVTPDEGWVAIRGGCRLGLISQIPVYPADYTVEHVLKAAHERIFALDAKMKQIAAKMSEESTPQLLSEYDKAAAEFYGNYQSCSLRGSFQRVLLYPHPDTGQQAAGTPCSRRRICRAFVFLSGYKHPD